VEANKRMEIDWLAEDYTETLAHSTKLELSGHKTASPQHAHSTRDIELASDVGKSIGFPKDRLVIAGESLAYQTFKGAGHDASITESLTKRMEAKKIEGRINLIYPRIPKSYNIGEKVVPVNLVDDLQASSLVGVQLEADASAVLPPLPSGIHNKKVFDLVMERTNVELQTFKKKKEVVGYIPTTDDLTLVAQMIRDYIKQDIRFFAVDFSSSPLNRWLIRTAVSQIRKQLKIKGKVGEKKDKYYYLHVFNVASNRKSSQAIAPITDLLTHAYGVDSTSGVIWGGGKLVKDKLRYYNIDDYGAYRLDSLTKNRISCPETLIEGNAVEVYKKLRVKRLTDYAKECKTVTERIPESGNGSSYASYLNSKGQAKAETKRILMDIKEIKAV